jgi:translation initiation factor IF-1
MPNIRGGKSYKKSKGKTKFGEDDEVAYLEIASDQMVGRILRLLGNLNATIYCQDNKQRVCKICRSIKKSVRFEVGDIVLISLRDCEVSNDELAKGIRGSRGDILDKFHPKQFKQLKDDGINAAMFLTLDSVNEIATKYEKGDEKGALAIAENAEEDIFDRTGVKQEDESEESELDMETPQNVVLQAGKKEAVVVDKRNKVSKRVEKKDDDYIDIDDI